MPATKIGDKIIRVDAIEKARGEATYVCDMTLPDMQYVKLLNINTPRSPEAQLTPSTCRNFRRAIISSLPRTFPPKERTSCG